MKSFSNHKVVSLIVSPAGLIAPAFKLAKIVARSIHSNGIASVSGFALGDEVNPCKLYGQVQLWWTLTFTFAPLTNSKLSWQLWPLREHRVKNGGSYCSLLTAWHNAFCQNTDTMDVYDSYEVGVDGWNCELIVPLATEFSDSEWNDVQNESKLPQGHKQHSAEKMGRSSCDWLVLACSWLGGVLAVSSPATVV